MDPVSPQPSPEPVVVTTRQFPHPRVWGGLLMIVVIIAVGVYTYMNRSASGPVSTSATSTSMESGITPIQVSLGTWMSASQLPSSQPKPDDDSLYWLNPSTDTIYCGSKPLTPAADVTTFSANQAKNYGGSVAKDKSTVWVECTAAPSIDPATLAAHFKIESKDTGDATLEYITDATHAWIYLGYWRTEYDTPLMLNLPLAVGADPSTFTFIGSGQYGACQGVQDGQSYFKDATHLYIQGYSLSDGGFPDMAAPDLQPTSGIADIASFQVLNTTCPYLEKDNDHVYVNEKVLSGADPATFMVMSQSSYYAKDSSHVYHQGNSMPGADAASFMLLTDVTSTTTNKKGKESATTGPAQYNGKNVDAKDATHYYYQGQEVE